MRKRCGGLAAVSDWGGHAQRCNEVVDSSVLGKAATHESDPPPVLSA
jgi:hypothetical protein